MQSRTRFLSSKQRDTEQIRARQTALKLAREEYILRNKGGSITIEDAKYIRDCVRNQLNGREPRDFQIELIIAQEERRDAVCQAATGMGKTLVAAGPFALQKNIGKVTIMVSPLIALQNELVRLF